MPYKRIQALCLSSEVPYKVAKEEIYKIFDDWWGKKFEEQAVDLIKKLDNIIATTKIRNNASNALDVQLHAGVIEQINAVVAMDNWKDRNRGNW